MMTSVGRRGIVSGMAKTSEVAGVFRGTWRIAAMDEWDREALDLVQPAFIRFDGAEGEFGMVAVQGWLECRYGERDGLPAVEFSWQGLDEGDERFGRGWAVLERRGAIRGHLFFHGGDDSGFVAIRRASAVRKGREARQSTGAAAARRSARPGGRRAAAARLRGTRRG